MADRMTKYDPWGPISATLFSTSNSDLVQTTIEFGGIPVAWPVLDDRTGYSHGTRIRAFRPLIQEAYAKLPDQEKGRFTQTVAKRLLESRAVRDELRAQMLDSLNAIGWTITDDGVLTTQDALVSEQFFPAGTVFDAYVAIRSILQQARRRILIVDAYIGSTIFVTLGAASRTPPAVDVLTTEKAIKPDFELEAKAFRQQFPGLQLEVRTTPEFHDRFIVIDGSEYYHVGASIKDAGKRAFLISRLRDQPIVDLVRQYVESVWKAATKRL